MSRVVVLDSGPAGLLARRGGIPIVDACNLWQDRLQAQGVHIVLPEIVDYEVRRELSRLNAVASIMRLDRLAVIFEYVPITSDAMRLAALLWGQSRQQGQPTADPKELDGDVILAAQTILLDAADAVVATTNVGHLSRFVAAQRWQDIA